MEWRDWSESRYIGACVSAFRFKNPGNSLRKNTSGKVGDVRCELDFPANLRKRLKMELFFCKPKIYKRLPRNLKVIILIDPAKDKSERTIKIKLGYDNKGNIYIIKEKIIKNEDI